MNLKVNLLRDEIFKHKNCIVNKNGIKTLKFGTKIFKCKCSEDMIICQDCKQTCHYSHQSEELAPSKMSNILFTCSCALADHKINTDKINSNKNISNSAAEAKGQCGMSKYYELFGFNYIYEKISKGEDKLTYCLFCAYSCNTKHKLNSDDDFEIKYEKFQDENRENENQEIEIIDEEKVYYTKLKENKENKINLKEKFTKNFKKIELKNSHRICNCSETINHLPREKEYLNLYYLIKKSIFSNAGLNIKKFCYNIFNEKARELYPYITEVFIKFNIDLNLKIIEKKNIYDYQVKNYVNKNFIYTTKVIDGIANNFKKSNFLLNTDENLKLEEKNFVDCLSLDFFIKLLSIERTENDFLISIIKQNLRIFRKLILNPRINLNNKYVDQIDENITPIHRRFNSRSFSVDFYADSKLNKIKFNSFFNLLQNNVIDSIKNFPKQKFLNPLFKLYGEYLHILNILSKYRFDDMDFIKKNVENIYDFLKYLFDNNTKNKIYLIRKQILKFIINVVIKINDEKFFIHLETKNKNEKIKNFEYCFIKSDFNNKLFAIFFMINNKTYSREPRDSILTEKMYFFLDVIMNKNDQCYQTLLSIVNNKKFILNFEDDKLQEYSIKNNESRLKYKEVLKIIEETYSFIPYYYKNLVNENDLIKKLTENFKKINEIFNREFYKNSKDTLYINSIQNILHKNGYLSIILHILKLIRQINKLVSTNYILELYKIIFENLNSYCYDNPFLAVLFFTNKFTNSLFFNRKEYNIELFLFYRKIFKILKKFSYKIDSLNILMNFRTHYNKESMFDIEKLENYDELSLVAIFFFNLIKTSNNISYAIISQHISNNLSVIFCENFYTKVSEIIGKFYKEIELNMNEKNIFFTYMYCIKVLNHIPDDHFVSTVSYLNKKFTKDLITKVLLTKELHPNIRYTFVSFYAKYNFLLSYKISNSKDFDYKNYKENFQENIPFICQENLKSNKIEELTFIINQLSLYPQILVEYAEFFKQHKRSFFKYFAGGFFLPCVNAILNILYFNEKINSELRYIFYKIVVLFCKGFHLFLTKIEEYLFYDSKLFYDYLLIEEGLNILNKSEGENLKLLNESIDVLKTHSFNIQAKLIEDLKFLDNEEFILKPKKPLSEIFSHYMKYFFLEDRVIQNFNFNKKKENQNTIHNFETKEYIEDTEIFEDDLVKNKENNENVNSNYGLKLNKILREYYYKKSNKNSLIYYNFFLDDRKYTETNKNVSQVDLNFRNDLKKSLFLILFDNIFDYANENKNLSYQYNEYNLYYLNKLLKVFKLDPSFCQNILSNEKNIKHTVIIIKEMITQNLICLFQLAYIDFNSISLVKKNKTYRNILKLLEFLRLMCEDQNRIFQTYLVQNFSLNQGTENNFNFIGYMFKNLEIINRFINYKQSKKYFLGENRLELNYFNSLSVKIVDLIVEVFQGNFPYNINDLIINHISFDSFSEIFFKEMSNIQNNIEIEKIVDNFMKIYLCLLQEHDLNEKSLEIITKNFNAKLIMNTICFCLNNLYSIYCNNSEEISDIDFYDNLKVDTAQDLLNVFIKNDEVENHHLFTLAINCFRVMKNVSNLDIKLSGIVKEILFNLKDIYLNKIEHENLNEGNKDIIYHRYEIYKFFDALVKNIEITFTKKDIKSVITFFETNQEFQFIIENNKEKFYEKYYEESDDTAIVTKTINFLVQRDALNLKEFNFDEFKKQIPIDNYDKRLSKIVEMKDDILNEVDFIKKILKYPYICQLLSLINYKYVEILSIFIVLVINILMIVVLDSKEILDGDESYQAIIEALSLANICFLIMVLLNYTIFNYLQGNKDIYTFFLNMSNSEIFSLSWNLILGIIGISNPKYTFLYSAQLFSLISVFDTMRAIIYTIRIRWRQFLSTLLLMMITILFFTGISFYFLRQYYIQKGDDENTLLCTNFIFCYFIILSNGIRMGGGIGDLIGLQSFNDEKFFIVFIIQWFFYFIIVLIMLNAINGIIVDTFQSLREKNDENINIRENTCFICGINRIKFQMKSLDFDSHQKEEHNFNNYIHYLIKIHRVNEHDLNSIDYETLLCIREKRTRFFPIHTSIALNSKK